MTRLLLAALLALPIVASPLDALQADPIVVYLVRHAERAEDGTDDPPISAEGEERARTLASMLSDARLTHIHTTDFRRTRATAEPVARATGLAPAPYDVDDVAGFAARIGQMPGRHLVVGHSNTLPPLVSALGGDPHDPIAQDEYDRFYVVTITPAGTSSVLLRFGARR